MMNLFILANIAILLFGFLGTDAQPGAACDYYWSFCDINAKCESHPDNFFTCKCISNYAGNGINCQWQSTLPEPCSSKPCDSNAYCRNVGNSYYCSCKEGYTGDGINCTSTSPEPCDSNPCHPNATCKNEGFSYSCACKAGYVGDGLSCSDLATIGEPFCPSSYAEWTGWFDRDDPTEPGDYEMLLELRKENPGKICQSPFNIQAQLLTGQPYQIARENVTINTKEGFYCRNIDQKDKKCRDYRVRFCCEKEPSCPSSTHRWTEWFDGDDPSGAGDFETVAQLNEKYPEKICCRRKNVHAQLVTGEPHQFADENVRITPQNGFSCTNSEQDNGKCHDYRVRFCCPRGLFRC